MGYIVEDIDETIGPEIKGEVGIPYMGGFYIRLTIN